MNDLFPGGQTAIVTGAAARAGAGLALIDRNAAALDTISRELSSSVVWRHAVDITDALAVSAAFADFPACAILVNGAGIEGPRGGLENCDPADLRRVMEINLFGGLNCIQAAVPKMKAAGGGAIVNIASTAGLVGSTRLAAYGVSKAAVVSMTRSLAISLAPSGIRVIDSPMFERTRDAASAEAKRAHMISIHPLGRLGQPEEVAQAVVYLASSASSYCTGVLLPVDGGRLA